MDLHFLLVIPESVPAAAVVVIHRDAPPPPPVSVPRGWCACVCRVLLPPPIPLAYCVNSKAVNGRGVPRDRMEMGLCESGPSES